MLTKIEQISFYYGNVKKKAVIEYNHNMVAAHVILPLLELIRLSLRKELLSKERFLSFHLLWKINVGYNLGNIFLV